MAATRTCSFCRRLSGHTIEDTPKQILTECRECFAVEVISKGEQRTDGKICPWWYHGWHHPDGRVIDADGKLHKPNNFGWWDRRATA
jgi:hypothetical protein